MSFWDLSAFKGRVKKIMTENSDMTFITNEAGENLLERFKVLIKDTQFFDVLVGYFYLSGFYKLYKTLEDTEKIRILVGINTDRSIYEFIQHSNDPGDEIYSHAEVKENLENEITKELTQSEDKEEVEEGVKKFLE